ncbi:molybdopterin cofactor-binding domain-containing protein [Singulisphaera sp. PoT]|uniref:xanthine dehydrogenase family protein molybdopterin-binding subunit n=1 Tax=Singulisphaera sp. PoT TaxID=3411797 RepID=UPI003BF4FD35
MTPRRYFEMQPAVLAGLAPDYDESFDRVEFHFNAETSRRGFFEILGAGLIIAVAADTLAAQQPGETRRRSGGGGRGGMGRGATNLAARLHIGKDGVVTVMTGKVECGQGARAELTQAAAEELRLDPAQIRLIMADTGLVPDDGGTFGSRSTPSTVPEIRMGCAAARQLLASLAAKRWGVGAEKLEVRDGKIFDEDSKRTLAYGDLATGDDFRHSSAEGVPRDVVLTYVKDWKVLGTSFPRPNGREIVTGAHRYPSDQVRPGMLYGKVLRRPSYGAKLVSIDLGPAEEIKDVIVVRDGDFVGVAAPTTFQAEEALDALADAAQWEDAPHPSSDELFGYLREHAEGGVPRNPFAAQVEKASRSLRRSYHVPYVQHAPMEPRAALAEWEDGKLTVWTASQVPFGVRGELVRAFGVSEDKVRVIIPDFGGGFGGKHSGECAVEAARLAKGAGKPVQLRWTRAEEFTWAQFRPAGLIEAEASLDDAGSLATWHFLNINSGGQEVQTPYRVPRAEAKFIQSRPPLRHGSYRALAATANTFARESFMDEMATLAGRDPLEFRLAHLEPGRLRDVLAEAAARFGWDQRIKKREPNVGVGLACGTDKGSFVAACVEVRVDPERRSVEVQHICQAYDCGKILNPGNLLSQVRGGIIMGLGPALHEAMRFRGGKMLNASFARYRVPRFADVPALDIHLMDHPEHPSVGAGETPLIAVAPAIANAVFAAAGVRVREMPIQLPEPAKPA